MKLQIRRGVFETNSSNTHSLTICTKEKYDKWKENKLFFDFDRGEKFFTKDELEIEMKSSKYFDKESYEEDPDDFFDIWAEDNEFYLFDDWGDEYLEQFYEEFITPSGDEMVAFGEFGRC